MKVAVIGGGAAGFFAALSVKAHHPEAAVSLLERSGKVLSKVRISGGGRCNVTNGQAAAKVWLEAYPRGGKMLRQLFRTFNHRDTMAWFEARGVPLKTEEDHRVFPVSNQSSSIIGCLEEAAAQLGITVHLRAAVEALQPTPQGIALRMNGTEKPWHVDRVIVAERSPILGAGIRVRPITPEAAAAGP
ncbi:MAG: NAD(P)/FAD-dependent oxidoreductase, partial [Bacteroidota bacterium]